MPIDNDKIHRFAPALPWSIWFGLLGLLTYGLLSPQPPQVNAALLPSQVGFWASKGVHLCSYAVLSMLVSWLPASRRSQLVHWAVLVLHGALTEALQHYIPGRTGRVEDVMINLVGIASGLILALLVFRFPPLALSSQQTA